MRGDERQPTLSSTAAWLKSLTSTVVQNATDSTDRRVFSDCCCERRGLVDQSATRASGGAIATPAHRACARTHSQSPATDGRYGFLSLGAAHRVASADESLLAKACVRSTSSEAASRSALAVLEVCSSGGTSGGTLLRLASNGRYAITQALAPGARGHEGLRWHQIRVRPLEAMFPNCFQKFARNSMR